MYDYLLSSIKQPSKFETYCDVTRSAVCGRWRHDQMRINRLSKSQTHIYTIILLTVTSLSVFCVCVFCLWFHIATDRTWHSHNYTSRESVSYIERSVICSPSVWGVTLLHCIQFKKNKKKKRNELPYYSRILFLSDCLPWWRWIHFGAFNKAQVVSRFLA